MPITLASDLVRSRYTLPLAIASQLRCCDCLLLPLRRPLLRAYYCYRGYTGRHIARGCIRRVLRKKKKTKVFVCRQTARPFRRINNDYTFIFCFSSCADIPAKTYSDWLAGNNYWCAAGSRLCTLSDPISCPNRGRNRMFSGRYRSIPGSGPGSMGRVFSVTRPVEQTLARSKRNDL